MITKDIIKYQYNLFFHEYHWEPQPCLRHAKVAKTGTGVMEDQIYFPQEYCWRGTSLLKKNIPKGSFTICEYVTYQII